MKIEGGEIVFSTGTVKSANCGFIGLSPDNRVGGGYDGIEFTPGAEEWNGEPDLSPAECVELADFMIKRWQEFRATHAEPAMPRAYGPNAFITVIPSTRTRRT